jgi:FkbM family methyltransferase
MKGTGASMPKRAFTRCKSMLARKELFRLWHGVYTLSLYGMGFKNASPNLNGEEFVASFILRRLAAEQERIVIFDVGSNKGDFISFFLSAAPVAEIHSFEPSRTCFSFLNEQFGSNSRVILNNCAAVDRGEHATLFEPEEGSISSTILEQVAEIKILQGKGGREPYKESSWHRVHAVSLDDYAEKYNVKDVSYVKIDVEGGERKVLEGMQSLIGQDRIRYVQLEINDCNLVTGLTLFKIGKMFPQSDVFRILPNGLVRLVGQARQYETANEIFQYSNCLIAPRNDTIIAPIVR